MKKCPFCAEKIQDEAIKCRYCSEFLNKQQEEETVGKVVKDSNVRVDILSKIISNLKEYFKKHININILTESPKTVNETTFPLIVINRNRDRERDYPNEYAIQFTICVIEEKKKLDEITKLIEKYLNNSKEIINGFSIDLKSLDFNNMSNVSSAEGQINRMQINAKYKRYITDKVNTQEKKEGLLSGAAKLFGPTVAVLGAFEALDAYKEKKKKREEEQKKRNKTSDNDYFA